ncbi:MAG: PilT/PilU family type 4a pilus ATPase [Nannocystaceae bacterium]
MAAIDALLNLLVAQRADALFLADGEVPALERRGERLPLSMPALDRELVAVFVADVLPREQQGGLASGPIEVPYSGQGGAAYRVRVELAGGRTRLTVRTGAAEPPPRRGGSDERGSRAAEHPGEEAHPPAPPSIPMRRQAPATPSRGAASPRPEVGAPPPRPAPRATVEPRLEAPRARSDSPPEGLLRALRRALSEGASDVIFSVGLPARVRRAGEWLELNDAQVDDDAAILDLLGGHLSAAAEARLAEAGSVDLPALVDLDGRSVRLRANLFRQHRGLAVTLRPLREDAPSLRELSLPPELAELVEFPHGLVLLCGPTGAGKSTTLVALIDHLARSRSAHILTLEDPIEHVYVQGRSLVHQREVGVHVESFAAGLRAALRESPDVILVGEMRDHETISAALTAAETGHLVLSTLHSGDAVMAIDRIIDAFPAEQQRQVRVQLADVLRCVVTQVLLPSRRPPGRVPAIERMNLTAAIAHTIRDEKTHQLRSLIQTGRAEGMLSLELSLAQLVRQGLLDPAIARAAARQPELLDGLLRR